MGGTRCTIKTNKTKHKLVVNPGEKNRAGKGDQDRVAGVGFNEVVARQHGGDLRGETWTTRGREPRGHVGRGDTGNGTGWRAQLAALEEQRGARVPPRAVRGRESRRGRGRGGSGRACGCCNWSSLSHGRAGAPRLPGVGHHGEHVLSNLLGRVL